MLSKDQLQAEVRLLRNRLQEFEKQLNQCGEVTIENASVGDTLPDGSRVIQKSGGLALLVAPKSTEVEAAWSKEFSEVFEALKSQGFNHSQWFVPTIQQLELAHKVVPEEFCKFFHWSSTQFCSSGGFCFSFNSGSILSFDETNTYHVRAFRCVTY